MLTVGAGDRLPAKKIKIEFFDSEGAKHTLTLEGHLSREKISRILDYMELMGGTSIPNPKENSLFDTSNKFERIKTLILTQFPDKIFSSKNIREAYFNTFGEDISLSVVSTYLSRLVDKGILNRAGSSSEWKYAIRSKVFENIP
ncbi:MAG: hypothetical protein QW265_01615 [Candidatus Bathyarchaeia archaeon]